MAVTTKKIAAKRYGVAEVYGQDFARLIPEELRRLASAKHTTQPCPFRGGNCNKKYGVCTLRSYEQNVDGTASPTDGLLVTVCPSRFQEKGTIRRWVGDTLLGTPTPREIKEVPFLKGPAADDSEDGKPVGRIDTIFVHSDAMTSIWCPAEIQAVYFSGKGTNSQYQKSAVWEGPGIPFPDETRRPDFRSSGPKRLMPQLQVKIPTLRRWGKKMAIITDRAIELVWRVN